jgi:hypothetical protein
MPPLSPAQQAQMDDLIKRARQPFAKGDPVAQHYIPQFFQERFADDRGELLVVSIDGRDRRRRHVKVNAVVNHLYTYVDEDVGETVAVEKILAQLDGDAVQPIKRLAGGFFFPPPPPDRGTLALWFAFLHVRDPFTRRKMEALADHGFRMQASLAAHPEGARCQHRPKTDPFPPVEY